MSLSGAKVRIVHEGDSEGNMENVQSIIITLPDGSHSILDPGGTIIWDDIAKIKMFGTENKDD